VADLRDSGSIAQDADVAFAFRESYYLAHQTDPDPDAVLESKNKLELNIA
jgi:replicative DNA helicase